MKNFRFALMMLIALATFAAPGLAQVTIGVKVDGVVHKTNPPATIVTTSEIAAQVYEPKWTTDGEYYFYYEVRGITATYSELLGTPPVSVVHDTHTLPDFTPTRIGPFGSVNFRFDQDDPFTPSSVPMIPGTDLILNVTADWQYVRQHRTTGSTSILSTGSTTQTFTFTIL